MLKIFDVSISYAFFPLNPKKTTRFEGFIAKDVPKGTRITVRCVKAKNGKKCRGKLGASMTIKKTKKKTNKLKVLNRKYPAGSNLEVTFSKTGYRTKIKILKVLKNRRPVVNTKCIDPGSTKRKSC